MWLILDDTERGHDFYQFYPAEQPDGDFGVDHLRIYIAPEIRTQLTDDTICQAVEQAFLQYGDGCEHVKIGHVNFTFDYYGDAPTNTISMDDDGCFALMLNATAGNA